MSDTISRMFLPVDKGKWIIGSLLLQRSVSGAAFPPLDALASWRDASSGFDFMLSHAPNYLRPLFQSPIQDSHVKQIKKIVEGITRENTTLEFIHQQGFDFDVPRPIFYTETETHSILFLQKLPGRTLSEAWPSLDDNWRSFYVQRIVTICETLAKIEGVKMCGVDRRSIPEQYLSRANDYRPESMTKICEQIGMATNTCVLYHADLGPTNIIIEPEPVTGSLGIIDWECVGFFPRGWIRTKFCVSSGHNIPNVKDGTRWRSDVYKALGQAGFDEYSDEFMNWLHS